MCIHIYLGNCLFFQAIMFCIQKRRKKWKTWMNNLGSYEQKYVILFTEPNDKFVNDVVRNGQPTNREKMDPYFKPYTKMNS